MMKKWLLANGMVWLLVTLLVAGCMPPAVQQEESAPRVLVVESFLTDITLNIAGDRIEVDTLIPFGVDPHTFQPAPRDVAKVSASSLVIMNGAGFETWMEEMLANAGGERTVVEASAGLTSRTAQPGEPEHGEEDGDHEEVDPHFWLDPLNTIRYVENIRDALITFDPGGSETYTRNAAQYIDELNQLHAWIEAQVAAIPPDQRKIVTNHESFGYYADRYGFQIIGTVIPGVSSGASPSAQQLAALIDAVRSTGARAIFMETGANPQLAQQVAEETGVVVVTDLYTHSLTPAGGPAPTYLEMMRYNTRTIVEALK